MKHSALHCQVCLDAYWARQACSLDWFAGMR